MLKVLILRFSSIGDIVLTSPVMRCLHQQLPEVEIHYATKAKFGSLVEFNPYVHKVHLLGKSMSELVDDLHQENFDLVLDLHNNVRTSRIKLALGIKSKTFFKLNWKKWLLVRFKVNALPNAHVVHRYLQTCSHLGVKYDGKGLDFFGDPEANLPEDVLAMIPQENYHVYAIGGTYFTKKLPIPKMKELFPAVRAPLVLIGDAKDGQAVEEALAVGGNKIINLCGKLSIDQSALVMQNAESVVSHDTGMMHIAAALRKKIISIWGNTVPDFGMWPLLPDDLQLANDIRFQVPDLPCRPCSKLGFAECPKGHFHCMNMQNIQLLAEKL